MSVLNEIVSDFFGFGIVDAESFDSNGLHNLRVKGLVGEIGVCCGNFVYNVHAFHNFSESGILTVKMRCIFMHDEELRACGIGYHGTSHGKNAFCMSEVIFEAVHGEFAFDVITGTAGACTVGTAALQHEVIDHSMKSKTVIETAFDKADKVVDGIGSDFGIEFCFNDITVLHGDGNNRIFCHDKMFLSDKKLKKRSEE